MVLHLGWEYWISSDFFLLPCCRRKGGWGCRVLPVLELGSDSGKLQEVAQKDTAAAAGAEETASNDEVGLHASSPQTPTVPTK